VANISFRLRARRLTVAAGMMDQRAHEQHAEKRKPTLLTWLVHAGSRLVERQHVGICLPTRANATSRRRSRPPDNDRLPTDLSRDADEVYDARETGRRLHVERQLLQDAGVAEVEGRRSASRTLAGLGICSPDRTRSTSLAPRVLVVPKLRRA
jgi:hypothetical protein